MTDQTTRDPAVGAIVAAVQTFPPAEQEQILDSAWERIGLSTADKASLRSAWRYHQNADSIQHQRHIIFILAQTIFFGGFAGSAREPNVQWLVVALGSVSAILWCGVANTLERRLDAMRTVLKADPVWRRYKGAVSGSHLLGGRAVFNWWLPILTFLAWMYLLVCQLIRV